MKTIYEIRLENARAIESNVGRPVMAEKIDMAYGLLSNYIGKTPKKNIGDDVARRIESAFGKQKGWMDQDHSEGEPAPTINTPYYRLEVAPDDDPSLRIPYLDVRGSCGGGSDNGYDALISKGYLVKEKSWFDHLGTSNKHLVAIYCDGDSMAPTLSHSSMVIVDTSKTKPINGKIFAVDTPSGTRIKRLKISIFGTWTLSSDNQDKSLFPDESIPPEMEDQIVIRGQVVYQQGFL